MTVGGTLCIRCFPRTRIRSVALKLWACAWAPRSDHPLFTSALHGRWTSRLRAVLSFSCDDEESLLDGSCVLKVTHSMIFGKEKKFDGGASGTSSRRLVQRLIDFQTQSS